MRALWLPSVLRAAGLTVHEVSGWKTRGSAAWGPVRGITCHHTAGSRTSSVEGEIRVLLNGSNSAPPPIAQLFLARSGDWHVVASGTCFHNRVGWDGPNEGYGNDALLGIEAQHSGGSEPWTDVQYRSYVTGVAALVRHKATGWNVPVSHVAGHKEHQPGSKSDPTFNMPTFRRDVADTVAAMARPTNGDDDMDLDDSLFDGEPSGSWKSRFPGQPATVRNALAFAAYDSHDAEKAIGKLADRVTLLEGRLATAIAALEKDRPV